MIWRLWGWCYFRCPPLWRLGARYYCPLPIGTAYTARACFDAGHCGCDNSRRFTSAQGKE